MSNMSYCRHENTAEDLEEVVEQWHYFDEEDSSSQEIRARKRIIELARTICEMEGEEEV